MQTISYKQACELLGVKYVTIKDAVLYGRLTKCAGVSGSLLLKGQVELFKNKKISPNSLTLEEREMWENYKKIAENSELLKSAISSDNPPLNNSISVNIVKQIQQKGNTSETLMRLANEALKHADELLISIRLKQSGIEELKISCPQ